MPSPNAPRKLAETSAAAALHDKRDSYGSLAVWGAVMPPVCALPGETQVPAEADTGARDKTPRPKKRINIHGLATHGCALLPRTAQSRWVLVTVLRVRSPMVRWQWPGP